MKYIILLFISLASLFIASPAYATHQHVNNAATSPAQPVCDPGTVGAYWNFLHAMHPWGANCTYSPYGHIPATGNASDTYTNASTNGITLKTILAVGHNQTIHYGLEAWKVRYWAGSGDINNSSNVGVNIESAQDKNGTPRGTGATYDINELACNSGNHAYGCGQQVAAFRPDRTTSRSLFQTIDNTDAECARQGKTFDHNNGSECWLEISFTIPAAAFQSAANSPYASDTAKQFGTDFSTGYFQLDWILTDSGWNMLPNNQTQGGGFSFVRVVGNNTTPTPARTRVDITIAPAIHLDAQRKGITGKTGRRADEAGSNFYNAITIQPVIDTGSDSGFVNISDIDFSGAVFMESGNSTADPTTFTFGQILQNINETSGGFLVLYAVCPRGGNNCRIADIGKDFTPGQHYLYTRNGNWTNNAPGLPVGGRSLGIISNLASPTNADRPQFDVTLYERLGSHTYGTYGFGLGQNNTAIGGNTQRLNFFRLGNP